MYTLWTVEGYLEMFWFPALYHWPPVNLAITHNWLGSLRHGNVLLLDIVWNNCWGKYHVLLTVQVFDYNIWYRIYLWTSVDTAEEEVLYYLAYYVVVFCLKITNGRPRGTENTFIQQVIWSVIFTNIWLPTIPIIQHSKFVLTKEEPIQFFSTYKWLDTIPIIEPSKFASMEGKQLDFWGCFEGGSYFEPGNKKTHWVNLLHSIFYLHAEILKNSQ